MRRFAVIGGGITGLVAAKALLDGEPGCEVAVIEKAERLGGLLAGHGYPGNGLHFDQGTHIFRETGNADVDGLLLESVTPEDLIHFEAGRGDEAGSVFEGRLQEHTHFPDLRAHACGAALLSAVRARAESDEPVAAVDPTGSAEAIARGRFGDTYAADVLLPMLSSMYQRPSADLAGFAILLPGLTRVAGLDAAEWLKVAGRENHRAVLAYPDQRALPAAYRKPRRSFYSRRLGTRAFIDGIASRLTTAGCIISTGSTLTSLELENREVAWTDQAGKPASMRVDGLVLTVGVIGAAHLLGIKLSDFEFERPMPHRLVHLVAEEPATTDLCYFYGLDRGLDYYRVTNYRAFAGAAADCRLTVEVLGERGLEDAALPSHIAHQLRQAGVLRSERLEFADVIRPAGGFPVPTVGNFAAMRRLGDHVRSCLPDWAVLGGIGAEPGLFFQNDVLEHVHRASRRLIQEGAPSKALQVK